jgi:predicted Zn-dependent peptidase
MNKLNELGIELYREKLTNGSSIFLYKRKGFPINIQIIFNAGARFGKKPGISHFLEHMLVAGSKKYPTKNALCVPLENIGGSIGATTSSEFLYMNINVADKEDIDIAIDVINESINNSLFDNKTIENERKAILSEIGNKKSNPTSNVWDIYKKVFFQDTILEYPILGTSELVSETTKEELVDEYIRLIKEGKPTLIVSGDIDIDLLKDKFDNIFSGTKDIFSSLIEKSLPIVKNKRIEIEKYTSDQIHMILGFRTSIHSNADNILGLLLSMLLAKGRTSILVSELRYKNGLVYNLNGSSNYLADYSTWLINTSANQKNVQKVIDIIFLEINKIKNKGITEDQLNFVRSKIIKSLKFSLQTSESLVNYNIFEVMMNQNNPDTLNDFVDNIEKVTIEDILKCAQKIFNKDNFFIALCGNVDEKEIKINF